MQHSKHGHWFVLAAAILWGTTGTAQAFAPASAQPAAIGAMRLAVGGAALLLLAIVRRSIRLEPAWPFWAVSFAVGSMAAYQLFFFAGVARTGVAVGTVVAIGSAPIIAGGLGLLLHQERPGAKWAFATLLAVAGCALLILSGDEVQVDFTGIALSMGAGASYAIYAVSSKRLLASHPPDAVVAVVFSLGAILLAPILLTANLRWLTETQGLMAVLHLGLLATALAYVLFACGLAVIPTAAAVTLSLAEPLTAALLGIFVLGETLTPPAILGVSLLFGGLATLSLGHKRGNYSEKRSQT